MNFFDRTRVQATDIYNQSFAFVTEKFKQVGKVFTISSAYGQILSVISELSSMILFFIEDSVTEMNILTASRTNSIRGLARLAGHDATRAVASTGEISVKVTSRPDIQGNQIIIPNFSRIKCLTNNKIYIMNLVEEQVLINVTDSTPSYFQLVQGEIFTQTFTGDGGPLQSFTVTVKSSVMVDNFFVKVYVNGELWRKYDSIYDMPRDAMGYIVKTGITGGLDLYFGNTNFGKVPPLGSQIRVEYLQTDGEGGNLREDQTVVFEWIDRGYSVTGDEVDLNTCTSIAQSKLITFGSNPEPTSLTRLLAPKTSRSYVFANPENYIVFLEKFNYFSVVDAYTTYGDAYLDDDNVIYLFLIPDISKRLQNNENYFTVPLTYFTLTQQEENKVLDVINNSGSKIVSTVVKIVDPVIKKYVVNVSLIVFEGYSRDVIRETIVQNLSDYFLFNRRRDLIPVSDLVKIIENVEGVDSVNVSFLCEDNEISKTANPSAPVIGLDSLGDIIVGKNEICVIRGGWKDRRGVLYQDGIVANKPCSVNINFKGVSKRTINTQIFQENMNRIMNK